MQRNLRMEQARGRRRFATCECQLPRAAHALSVRLLWRYA
jgi:hypothetical protein